MDNKKCVWGSILKKNSDELFYYRIVYAYNVHTNELKTMYGHRIIFLQNCFYRQ